MDIQLVLNNLLSAPVLFFVAGLLAVAVKSDLEIPKEISRFLSIYLLFSIGLKGGAELGHSSFNFEIVSTLLVAVAFSFIVPIYSYFIIRKKVGNYNAGAIAATYGSVSAVTFVTTIAFLNQLGQHFGGHMVAALALMESPSIIVGVLLIRKNEETQSTKNNFKRVLHESVTNGSVFLLLASLVVGFVIKETQYEAIAPFSNGLFKGILCLFLLDMGLLAGKRLSVLKKYGSFLIGFALLMPLFNGLIMMLVCRAFGFELGNALLLTVLAASASYIAVPAAMRIAVPQANPGMYVPMSLGITFPLNVIIGIPVYYSVLTYLYQL